MFCFAGSADRNKQIWKISVPPASAAGIATQLRQGLSGEVYYDWGGGLLWLAISPETDAAQDEVRAALISGGHATLIRADEAVRKQVEVFQPQPAPLAALSARVKDAFDPKQILNPGRMVAESEHANVFTPAQMADPHIQDMNRILRTCVHCGFCNSTCPTYVLLGDELDSPRGRIYLIKDMLEQEKPASAKVTTHLDRCLSCLSCTTTCPSGVDYMHLIDQARVRVEKTYRRPFFDRLVRGVMACILPNPALFRWSLLAAWIFRPLRFAFPARLKAMLNLTPSTLASPSPLDRPQTFSAEGEIVKRVALLTGVCTASVGAVHQRSDGPSFDPARL